MKPKLSRKSDRRLPKTASAQHDNGYGLDLSQEIRPSNPRKVVAPLVAQTEAQAKYINAIKTFTLIFGVGPAGTGKTYISGALAAQALSEGKVEKIIITRPVVEAGESLGFLPGTITEKYEPYLQPLRAVFYERLGKGATEYFLKGKTIEPMPLAYMRGITFKDAFVILDEAQNVSPSQMKMFLTRIGHNCTVVINGDPEQIDIQGPSGLIDAARRIGFIPAVKIVTFGTEDVVRSGLVQEILEAYATKKP